ncbi:hypothetical protein G3M74_13175 [Paenibacillus polymyxa]|nr:hypothetical protein [Paenibacillus polymyxa]
MAEYTKTKNIPYRLDPQEHKKLKLFCVEHGIPMQQFLDKAVNEYMKKWSCHSGNQDKQAM